MKKKSYLKPDVKVHQFRPTAILAGSPQANDANEQYNEQDTQSGDNKWTWN